MDVSRALKNPGQVFDFQTSVELEPMEVLGDPVRFTDVAVQGEYLCAGENRISVKAGVSARVETRCSRCLEPACISLNADVDAVYDRQPDPEDPDLYSFEASSIELSDAVKDALLLNLPLSILCSEDCKGLCPVCGIDLNRGSCTCHEGADVTNPFAALKNILLEE